MIREGITRDKRRKKAKEKGLRQVKTRGTFAWKAENKTVSRVAVPPTEGESPFCPVGQPGTIDLIPTIRDKGVQTYSVYWKRPKSLDYIGKHPEIFTKCCEGVREPIYDPYLMPGVAGKAFCKRSTCAACWTREHKPPQGCMWCIKMNPYDPARSDLVDPHGVSSHGHRSQGGQGPSPEELDPYRLSSGLHHYKGEKQIQIDPRAVEGGICFRADAVDLHRSSTSINPLGVCDGRRKS
jgi:hypothetical protein